MQGSVCNAVNEAENDYGESATIASSTDETDEQMKAIAALAPAGLAPVEPHLAVHPVTIARVPEHASVPQNHIFLRPTGRGVLDTAGLVHPINRAQKRYVPLSVKDVPMRAPLADTMVFAKFRVRR